MIKYLVTLILAIGIVSCSTSETVVSRDATVVKTASYTLLIDESVPNWWRTTIELAVKNAIPGDIDRLHVTIREGMNGWGAGQMGSYSTIYLSPRIDSASLLAHVMGHELAHADPDIRALPPHEREIACDHWGAMTVIDLGLDPRVVQHMYRKRNFPAGDTHPSDATRADRMEETIRNYKKS